MGRTGLGRRVAGRLPGRVVVAWTVLGAAAGLGLMYAPPVYDGRAWSHPPAWTDQGPLLGRLGMTSSGGSVRVLGQVVYEAESLPWGDAQEEVDRWHRRVALRLAGLGALVGALVGWRERRRAAGRAARPGGLIGLAVAAVVFAVLAVAGVPGQGPPTFADWVRWEVRMAAAGVQWEIVLDEPLLWDGARLGLAAAAVGWAVQAATASRGVRFPAGKPLSQAEDYADAEAGPPGPRRPDDGGG